MFNNNKKTPIKHDEIDTVIGAGTRFEGKVEATGIVRIDGVFVGEIATKGDIIIGDSGNAQGKLIAKNMIVAGVSQATLTCEGKLEVKASGKVYGDVQVDSITIEEGAIFQGNCQMRQKENKNNKEVVDGK